MQPLLAIALTFIPTQSPTVRLESVRYSELVAEVKALQGKVLLVDVWGSFCGPCKEKFPHVVAMHGKFATRGLAVMSVSVDIPEDMEARAAARDFLIRQKATFRNVILSDPATVWQTNWKTDSVPIVFLFDKRGQLAARWDGKIDPAAVEKKVVALLEE